MYGGEQNPPPPEWIDYILQTNIYVGMHPDEIAELDEEDVQKMLLMYQIAQQNQGKK